MLEATPNPATAGAPEDEPPRWWLGPRMRWGLSVGSLLVLLVVVTQWLLALGRDARSIAGRYDFSTYYAAAYALRHNLHADMYNQAVLTRAGAAAHVLVQPPLAYTYPPLFALVLSPFTLLSFQVLSRVWLVGNAALWLAITALLTREIAELLRPALPSPRAVLGRPAAQRPAAQRPADESAPKSLRPQSPPLRTGDRSPLRRGRGATLSMLKDGLLDNPRLLLAPALAAWLSLTFVPAAQTLLTGQINFLVLAPLALVPLLLRSGHDRWAGTAVAVAAILKFTPAVLIVYLLLRRRWQAAASAVIVLAGLFVLPALVVGPGVTAASIGQALHIGSGDAGLGHNQALFAPLLLFASLHAPAQLGAATLLARVILVLLALALGYVIWRLPAAGVHRTPLRADAGTAGAFGAGDAAAYGVALCGLLLLSPTAWVHHYVWVLPAAAIALGLAVTRLVRAVRATGIHRTPLRGLLGAVALLALVVLACAALGVSLPYDWDTNPQPAITQAGLWVWPLALLLRPVATLVLAGLLALLGGSVRGGERPLTGASTSMQQLPLAPQGEGDPG